MNPVLFGLICMAVFIALCSGAKSLNDWLNRKHKERLKPYEPVHPPTVGEPKPFHQTEL